MTLVNLHEKFNQIKAAAEEVDFSDVRLPKEFKTIYNNYISKDSPNGYSSVEWVDFSTEINTTFGISIFLTNYWFYIAYELAVYLESLTDQSNLFFSICKWFDFNAIAKSSIDDNY